jgi:adenylate cyclase
VRELEDGEVLVAATAVLIWGLWLNGRVSAHNTEFRKLAAIMFTDMVGFSALSQRDEALALDLLEEHRRIFRGIIPNHAGREVKTTGDGFLLEFNSALAAVLCAVEMQRALQARNASGPEERAVRVRIGIHVGDVVTSEGDIHGDGVNIASRIEPLAAPGGICVSEDVKRQVQNKIPELFVKIGAAPLKNIHAPMEIYQIQLGDQSSPIIRTGATRAEPARPPQKSIAVLSFANMSSDQENEFLSDGITEDLITALSKIPGLRVPARTSSFAFKGKNEDIRVIGEKLNVTTVLEGSVRKSGNRLRITAQLISVADGFHLWSERYDRAMEDVFAIQDEITRAIVTALKVQLVGEAETLVKAPTASMEAYQLYLKGREFWFQRGRGLLKALHYFELALLEDAKYTLAYCGLADTLTSLTFYGYGPASELIPKARGAIARALELDADSADAHLSKASIKSWHDWDFEGAEAEYLKAQGLKPNYALAHSFYGAHLCGEQRTDEALAESTRAAELDPLSPFSLAFLGWMHSWSRRHEGAEAPLRKSLQLAPDFALAHWIFGQNYAAQGRYPEAIASFEKAAQASGNAAWVRCIMGHAYAASGQQEKALAILAELEDPTRQPFHRHFHSALIYAGLGDVELVFHHLELAFEQHDLWLRWLWSFYAFDQFHGDARFAALAEKIGLRKMALTS